MTSESSKKLHMIKAQGDEATRLHAEHQAELARQAEELRVQKEAAKRRDAEHKAMVDKMADTIRPVLKAAYDGYAVAKLDPTLSDKRSRKAVRGVTNDVEVLWTLTYIHSPTATHAVPTRIEIEFVWFEGDSQFDPTGKGLAAVGNWSTKKAKPTDVPPAALIRFSQFDEEAVNKALIEVMAMVRSAISP